MSNCKICFNKIQMVSDGSKWFCCWNSGWGISRFTSSPINTSWPFSCEGHHAKFILIFSLNYSSLVVTFRIKSGCCDENSAFESRKAWRCIGNHVDSERLPEQPHLPCYSLSIILPFIPLLIILPFSVICDMVVARWSMHCSFLNHAMYLVH